jgi:phospholipid/cholesterol/gamma-HCH transport system substrate-binding protein
MDGPKAPWKRSLAPSSTNSGNRMSQRSIEVKVGVLILVALGLLGAFVVVMGGLSLEPTMTVYVDFDNPGALQTGAPVKISGVKVGRVTQLQFRGGEVDPATNEPVPIIRVVTEIETAYQKAIHDDSRWYITTQGVLGEQFLAVEPGSHARPLLHNGSVVHGISPPRLDLLLSESYELLHKAYSGINANEDKIYEIFLALHSTLKGTGQFFDNNQQRLENIVANTETLTVEANDALHEARERYVTGPQVTRIMNNVERTSTALNRDLPPLLQDGREIASDGKKMTRALASEEQLRRYDQITRDMSAASGHARQAAATAQSVVARVERGEGTVGALLADEAVYDDLQEMLRDLKHNPWKFFWKE